MKKWHINPEDLGEDGTGIYAIKTSSGLFYYGQTTTSFVRRWKSHLNRLWKGTHHCLALQAQFNQSSILRFAVLERVHSWEKVTLRRLEKTYVANDPLCLNSVRFENTGKRYKY